MRSIRMEKLAFSAVLEPQPEGGFTVTAPALPEVVTGMAAHSVMRPPRSKQNRGVSPPILTARTLRLT